MMNSRNEGVSIKDLVVELVRQFKDDPSPQYVDKLLRLLRPAPFDLAKFAPACKRSIKNSIQEHEKLVSNAPFIIGKFETACDNLRKISPLLHDPLLIFLAPLSFQNPASNQSILRPVSDSNVEIHDNKDPRLTIAIKDVKIPSNVNSLPLPTDADVLRSMQENEVVGKFWISKDLEYALIKDLIFVFQVSCVVLLFSLCCSHLFFFFHFYVRISMESLLNLIAEQNLIKSILLLIFHFLLLTVL